MAPHQYPSPTYTLETTCAALLQITCGFDMFASSRRNRPVISKRTGTLTQRDEPILDNRALHLRMLCAGDERTGPDRTPGQTICLHVYIWVCIHMGMYRHMYTHQACVSMTHYQVASKPEPTDPHTCAHAPPVHHIQHIVVAERRNKGTEALKPCNLARPCNYYYYQFGIMHQPNGKSLGYGGRNTHTTG